MKVALLDRRFGPHGGDHKTPNTWGVRYGIDINNPGHIGNGNTFAFMDAFGEVMTGPIHKDTDYSILKDYDLVYLRIRGEESVIATKNLRKTCPDTVLIGYTDEWVGFRNFTPDSWITRTSENLDAITCGFGPTYEKEAFKGMGVKNYYHLPYGSAVRHWEKWYRPRKEKDFVIAGMWHIRSFKEQGKGDKVHTNTFNLMRALQEQHGIGCRFFLNFDGWKCETEIRNYIDRIGLNVDLLKHVQNAKFNELMASSLLFYEEYPAPAYSRATVVSAAVGTPQISTDMNEPSIGCFPDLTVEYGEWGRVRELAERLITDPDFWNQQSEAGRQNCYYYWYPSLKERILELYNKLKK